METSGRAEVEEVGGEWARQLVVEKERCKKRKHDKWEAREKGCEGVHPCGSSWR